MLGLLPSPVKWGGACLIVGLLAFSGGYFKGRADGARNAETGSLRATIQQLKERGVINENVNHLSDCDLLRILDPDGVCDNGD